ncbi:class I SAM-dependent methyltransferase [Candidatus Sumerlaeota bacterium]|nr:class I SAM-dependent methyltransferase [Candidatus Sumerlaeota bacterium]
MTTPDQYAPSAPFYDLFPVYTGREDVEFYVQAARASEGPVLEIGCGTGRVLIPTAREGLTCVGVDPSAAMLERCRANLAAEPSELQGRITLVESEMQRLDLGRLFALITCPFRPFQHILSTEDQIEALRHVHRHLAPGGRFIIDIFDPRLDALLHPEESGVLEPEEFTDPATGERIVRRTRRVAWDRTNQILALEFLYERHLQSGGVEFTEHPFGMRYIFRWEMEHLLERCGLGVVDVFGDFERGSVISGESRELIFVCERRD